MKRAREAASEAMQHIRDAVPQDALDLVDAVEAYIEKLHEIVEHRWNA